MDVKRLLLVIPLAVLAYLLVIQWNADYGQNNVAQRAPTSASQNGSSNDAAEEGLSAPSSAGNGSVSQGAANMPGKKAQTSSEHMVRVRTDVLDLHIDAQGGDVIYAALPKYKAALNSEQPFVLLSDNQRRSYVAKSGLQLGSHDGRITYTPSKTQYSLDKGQDVLTVDLKANIDGVDIIKRFTFDRGRYAVKVQYLVANQSQTPVSARFIGQLARDNSPDPSQGGGPMSMKSFLGATFSTQESNYEKISFEDIREDGFKNVTSEGGWVAMIQHYFTSAWVPRNDQKNLYYTSIDSRDRNVAAFAGPTRRITPGDQATLAATLYVGPKIQDRLEAIAPNLELTVDFGWLWFIANPLFWLLAKIHSLIGNWGWSIVLLTVVVKIVLFPLSAKAYKSMAKMRKMGPEMKRIKEQYGDDRQKMSQEMMKFYQKEKINPLGGCLPIVVQMPVFIALYWMLLESVELRHAPFMLWINDLSAQDPYFILPIIMGASMFVQQLLNPTPPDPMQAKIMKMLPVIFTFFFLWFPAGLVIYWICNNVISILQQWIITRKIESDGETGKASKAKS